MSAIRSDHRQRPRGEAASSARDDLRCAMSLGRRGGGVGRHRDAARARRASAAAARPVSTTPQRAQRPARSSGARSSRSAWTTMQRLLVHGAAGRSASRRRGSRSGSAARRARGRARSGPACAPRAGAHASITSGPSMRSHPRAWTSSRISNSDAAKRMTPGSPAASRCSNSGSTRSRATTSGGGGAERLVEQVVRGLHAEAHERALQAGRDVAR